MKNTHATGQVPDKFSKPDGGADVSTFISGHSEKHKFDATKISTKNKSQFGQNIDVKALVDDTMVDPTSVNYNADRNITKYSKSYDFNISTEDTPTGEMRVFINHNNADRSTQFPYVSRN